MASWDEFARYVRSNYTIAQEGDDSFFIVFDIGEGRTQMVLLARTADQAGEWVHIQSPVGQVGKVPLEAILREAADKLTTGGFVIMGDMLFIRHAVYLLDISLRPAFQIETPLLNVARDADMLEKKYTGTDVF